MTSVLDRARRRGGVRPGVAPSGDAPAVVGDGRGRALTLAGVTKAFGRGPSATVVLDGLDLAVADGEFVCMVGASGCGKTTLLNMAAGLDAPTSGTIDAGGRRVTLMFQEGGLFPWLTAAGNVELALKLRGGLDRTARRDRARELLHTVRLGDAAERRPHELSGGMRQRVSLARALAQDAEILLMDEPFGALDAMTRDVLHDELERVWAETGLTVLFVTHNVREAARLGDRIVLLGSRPGRVLESWDVGIDRPRRIESPEVSGLAAEVTNRLRDEVGRHGH